MAEYLISTMYSCTQHIFSEYCVTMKQN